MENSKEEILLKFMKTIDINGRILLPVEIRKMFGEDYYLEVYKDHVKLIPIKREK